MKIKEVIGKTGLTDRAIRLYISNGLVDPECKKSYTGRSNFDFSDADVVLLQQISLLRKADFSIEQIKVLRLGGEQAREMLHQYVETKREKLKTDQKILSALAALPADQMLSLPEICMRIEEGLREKTVPDEDMKPTKAERAEAWGFRIMAILFCLVFGLPLILLVIYYSGEFPFPKPYGDPLHYIGVAYFVVPLLMMAAILILYCKAGIEWKRRKIRRFLAIIMAIFAVLLLLLFPLELMVLWAYPAVYSETSNPAHYMQLGTCEQSSAFQSFSLFPAAIPRSAISWNSMWYPPDKFPKTTKYYYKHVHDIDPYFDIFAEWVLPEDEFAAEKERIQTLYPDGPAQQVDWGDWICQSFLSDPLESADSLDNYHYIVFAYNDKTSTVRYITSYSVDWGDIIDPYFLSLDWY